VSHEELSPADRSSLAAEHGPVNMAAGGLLVFDADPPLTRSMLVERIGARIHLMPRLRQRLEETPLGLANPVWTDDAGFDLDWHVRQVSLPDSDPGGDRTHEIGVLVGREFSHRLTRTRPLWEATVIEGMRGGRTGVLMKIHHALVDGIAAIGLAALVLDPSEEPLEIPPPEQDWEPRKYDRRARVTRLARAPLGRAPKWMVDGVLRALDPDPWRTAADMRRATEVGLELARARPQAPMSPLNRPISPNRRYAVAHTPLEPLRRAGRLGGGTVNDAVLAIVAGMLGRYLAAAGPEAFPADGRAPVALVPVSVREGDAGDALGNRISTVFVDLPVTEHNLIARVRAISSQTSQLKASAAVRAGSLMVGAAGWAPPLLSGMLARALGTVRAFNLVVSNIPGPQQPFYLNGVALREVYPVVPLNPTNQGLSVGVISYDGQVCFGVLADRDLEPPLSTAAAGLTAALSELQGLRA
jgi:diacylglycerol O-acyltransferase / wax synthase